MRFLDLNGKWKMRRVGDESWLDASVPGSVFNDLLRAKKIKDPYYRDNEDQALAAASFDYEYVREFDACPELLKEDRVILRCEGLDTLTRITLNQCPVAFTSNMHRSYEFDVKALLKEGGNTLSIVFLSPLKYIEEKQRETPVWGAEDAISGFPHIRKGHYMFGWDWGPKIPDSGIWKDISLAGWSGARLEDVYITQIHENGRVRLDVRVRTQAATAAALPSAAAPQAEARVQVQVQVFAPEKGDAAPALLCSASAEAEAEAERHIILDIDDPELWWPNGYGGQPLYTVKVALAGADQNAILDSKELKIGLRTLGIRKEKDGWGESFEFNVNGVSIFAMGADYIPEDNILANCSPRRTERLIKDCVEANFNCIRVWGGGLYPFDYFYDLCDRYGLIVWQDFMFACAVYDLNGEFEENIKKEAEDNIKRIRHHACLGLWCGNNEMEEGWVEWGFSKTASAKHRNDYLKMFEVILPEMVRKFDPNTFYWPSSPSSGGGFADPNCENKGDVHYWDVWHGQKPFTEYRKFHFRFCSEFGFQAFPPLKTVESFTIPEDRNIFSYVMEKHQKNGSANGRILYYLSDNYKYPKDFSHLLYTSQILQAEAIKYGVEHWRRNRGRCMGAIYWQLNDCWPVASWAGIDSKGRWKALHYYAKRFFAPVLISAREEGTRVELHITNETMRSFEGTVKWALRDRGTAVLREGSGPASVPALSALRWADLDFNELLADNNMKRSAYLEYSLETEGKAISGGTVLFTRPKHFGFLKPEITVKTEEGWDKFTLLVTTSCFARNIELDLVSTDCRFSDNYFDLSPGTVKQVEVPKNSLSVRLGREAFEKELTVRSIFDIA